jgi:hypothetical protein
VKLTFGDQVQIEDTWFGVTCRGKPRVSFEFGENTLALIRDYHLGPYVLTLGVGWEWEPSSTHTRNLSCNQTGK